MNRRCIRSRLLEGERILLKRARRRLFGFRAGEPVTSTRFVAAAPGRCLCVQVTTRQAAPAEERADHYRDEEYAKDAMHGLLRKNNLPIESYHPASFFLKPRFDRVAI